MKSAPQYPEVERVSVPPDARPRLRRGQRRWYERVWRAIFPGEHSPRFYVVAALILIALAIGVGLAVAQINP